MVFLENVSMQMDACETEGSEGEGCQMQTVNV